MQGTEWILMKTTDLRCVWLCGCIHVCGSQSLASPVHLPHGGSSLSWTPSLLTPCTYVGSGDLTLVLTLAHQVLCPLSHLPSLQPWAPGTLVSSDMAVVLLKSVLWTWHIARESESVITHESRNFLPHGRGGTKVKDISPPEDSSGNNWWRWERVQMPLSGHVPMDNPRACSCEQLQSNSWIHQARFAYSGFFSLSLVSLLV